MAAGLPVEPLAPVPGAPRRFEDAPALLRGQTMLRSALLFGDLPQAELAMQFIQRVSGDYAEAYATAARLLDEIGRQWEGSGWGIAEEHRAADTLARLIARLRSPITVTSRQAVLLTTPPGDRHTLGIQALGHLLTERGYAVTVAGDMPWRDVAAVAGSMGDAVVGISVHLPIGARDLREGIQTLRRQAPGARIVAGGRVELPRHLPFDAVAAPGDPTAAVFDELANPLSIRERDVLLRVAEGRTNNQIADELGVRPATVKTHLDRLFGKLGAPDRASAVAAAMRQGWLS